MKYYFPALKNYSNFKGRAGRREYWYFMLFSLLILILIVVLGSVLNTASATPHQANLPVAYPIDNFYLIFFLFSLTPGVSATVRRLHDTGKHGWLLLILLIPALGFLILFILLLKKGQPYANKFGGLWEASENNRKIQQIGNYLSSGQ